MEFNSLLLLWFHSQHSQHHDYVMLMIWWLMNTEQLVERQMAGEIKMFGANLPLCHSVHQKSHMMWSVGSHTLNAWAIICLCQLKISNSINTLILLILANYKCYFLFWYYRTYNRENLHEITSVWNSCTSQDNWGLLLLRTFNAWPAGLCSCGVSAESVNVNVKHWQISSVSSQSA